MTVRAQCRDADSSTACWDDPSLSYDNRAAQLRANCECAAEQHYQYRWDELNRLVEARRYDRAGSGDWALAVRQRYRYDAANQRLVKQTLSEEPSGPPEAVSLYVFPGDYERRGVTADQVDLDYDPSATLGTESQYLIAGARVVFKPGGSIDSLDREMRITQPLTDLIGSTSAVLDLDSGELLEAQTFYPNGAVETQQTTERVSLQLEPRGFTGKEADDEVGVVYFGERYLFQHLGRWASPDPLHVHSAGGGEALNSYHYVAGDLLQARDPLGLEGQLVEYEEGGAGTTPGGDPQPIGGEHPDAEAMEGEFKHMIRNEAMWRAEARMAQAEAKAARGEDVDWGDVGEDVMSILDQGEREAKAVRFDESGRLQVDDLYVIERLAGAPREELGGMIYERLMYIAEHDTTQNMGYWSLSDETQDAIEKRHGGTLVGACPNAEVCWSAPPSERPHAREASTHEPTIHAYRRLAGMNPEHRAREHGNVKGPPGKDNTTDIEGHFMIQIQAQENDRYRHYDGSTFRVSQDPDQYPAGPVYRPFE